MDESFARCRDLARLETCIRHQVVAVRIILQAIFHVQFIRQPLKQQYLFLLSYVIYPFILSRTAVWKQRLGGVGLLPSETLDAKVAEFEGAGQPGSERRWQVWRWPQRSLAAAKELTGQFSAV